MRCPRRRLRLAVPACIAAVAAVAASVGAAARASAGEDPAWYVRKGTWQETMFASRGALVRHLAEKAEKEGTADGGKPVLGPWWGSRTFAAKKGYDTSLPPEDGAVPTADRPDVKKMWRRQNKWRDGTIIGLKGGGATTVYAFRRIEAKGAVRAPAWLGCDDRMTVWVNGKHAFTSKGFRGVAPNQDKITLPLDEGSNDLLIKVFNNGGAFAFYFSTTPRPRTGGSDDTAKIWDLMARDFTDRDAGRRMQWERADRVWDLSWDENALRRLAGQYAGRTQGDIRSRVDALARKVEAEADLAAVRELYYKSRQFDAVREELRTVDLKSLRLAVEDLTKTYPSRYGGKGDYLGRLDEFEESLPGLRKDVEAGKPEAVEKAAELVRFQRDALLANPLLDFDRIAVVRRRFGGRARGVTGGAIGAPGLNSHTNDDIKHSGWDNEIAVLSNLRGTPRLTTLFKPEGSPILRDMEVDFDAKRIMFSSIGANDRWALFEIAGDGSGVTQITPTDLPDVDFFDSCYLPDGRIVTCSTASYQGLPCEGGGRPMVNLYLMDREKDTIRQLTFEQDSDYHPCVLGNGRLLYLRWEYSDIQHYYSRILFSCNPDGTNQMEYYGSGSYFPTAFKHARPCPGHPRKVVGIISGHHATPETGRMAIIDPALGRKYPLRYRPKTVEWGSPGSTVNVFGDVLPAEKTGFVQEIPGHGKHVVGNVYDGQGTNRYPNFVYPFPLSDKYIIVSMKRDRGSLWGIYLVDVFDNMTLIKEEEGAGLFDAFPFVPRPRPPILPDRVRLGMKTANVYITDVYSGPGLEGIPRGTVKRLRLLAYHFAYNRTGGHAVVGVESSWDVKRILGTVPVEEDGSAYFTVPANTPISIQPLDGEGAALQLMRSWMVGKPGENVSCAGCHEKQNQASANRLTAAARREAAPVDPWLGPARPFAFKFEVQPVLEQYCVGCHDGRTEKNGRKLLSFRDDRTSYRNLHPYVRRPGPESDLAMLRPMEYHASTSPLVQMLKKGHQNVRPDREAWERIYCWIDLNAPYRGSWGPRDWRGQDQVKRRRELASRYAGVEADPETAYRALDEAFAKRTVPEFVKPGPVDQDLAPPSATPGQSIQGRAGGPRSGRTVVIPFKAEEARRLQAEGGGDIERQIDLGGGRTMRLVLVPGGEFVIGSQTGYPDEQPRAVVSVKPFWMGVCEVTNAQYARFDPEHDTRYYDEHGKDQAVPGYIGNHDEQPVARVSWREAAAFCRWLSSKSGGKVTLPTEAEWEWAARAGSATPFYYGGLDADFSGFANLSDKTRLFTKTGWDGGSKIHKRRAYDAKHHFPLRDDGSDDESMVASLVGRYKPNGWGLKDMIGNVCEWTESSYRPYPYQAGDGRNDGSAGALRLAQDAGTELVEGAGGTADGTALEKKVARGGSWHDRPKTATASVRFVYAPYQKVFNVGFRVVMPAD